MATNHLKPFIEKRLQQNPAQIQKLVKYKNSGFQKTEIIERNWSNIDSLQVFLFIVEGESKPMKVAGLVIDLQTFIEDLIGPKLQLISKDQFILSVYDKARQAPVYSTQLGDTARITSEAFTKDFWIFPNYSLGIRTQGTSLQQIVRARTSTNLLLLTGLVVVLIIALVLAYRNVKKEVQLAQNKSDFVSNVSHEIRTPLALISMFAETLEMNRITSEEKKQEYYSIIHKEAHRLTGIINKILTFSQTEAGKKTLHIELIKVRNELSEILNTYDFHLKNKGFDYTLEATPEVEIKADREALTEIIINLIDNAIKYSGEEKKIHIRLGSQSDFGWIAIQDYGLGISKADQKHIFDKFYRVSSGNLAKTQGTGIGLSLVKQLVEQQNGKISVNSDLGLGSTFTLYFPLA
jgi:two-component system phosphate regulon sensor histidine kinase PhoR